MTMRAKPQKGREHQANEGQSDDLDAEQLDTVSGGTHPKEIELYWGVPTTSGKS